MTWFLLGFLTWPAAGLVFIAVTAWRIKSKPAPRFRTLEELGWGRGWASEICRPIDWDAFYLEEEQAAIERLLKEVGGR